MGNATTAIIWNRRHISWQQLQEYTRSVCAHLKTLGVKPNQRVALCSPTSPEYIILMLSLWRMRAVACPINPRLPVAAMNAYLSQIHVDVLLTTQKLRQALPGINARVYVLNEVVGFDARKSMDDLSESWLPNEDDEVTVIATSGSQGNPKAVVHTWANHVYNAQGSQEIIKLESDDRWLLSLPLYHVSGLAILVRSVLAKSAMVIAAEDDAWVPILKGEVTHVSLVSTQMLRLLKSPQHLDALKKLKAILLGGSAMPASIDEVARAHQLPVYISYGLTEMASQVATGKLGEPVRVLSHRELKISSEGEILVRGKTLFKGYIQAGHLVRPLTEDGWFKTGDLGRYDQDSLSVLGRVDNMFISGGENVQPEEIERELLKFPGVINAVVVPKADSEFGFRPLAFVQLEEGQVLNEDVLKEHCRKYLPGFKIPQYFRSIPSDFIRESIKISRLKLKQQLECCS